MTFNLQIKLQMFLKEQLICTVHQVLKYYFFAFIIYHKFKVTNEQALKYPEVKKCLDDSIEFLEEWVEPFVDAIVKTANKLPLMFFIVNLQISSTTYQIFFIVSRYSIRYISKVLRQKLSEKFPNVPDKDILKASLITVL